MSDSEPAVLRADLDDEQLEVTFVSGDDKLVLRGVTFETCEFSGVTAEGLRFVECEFYDCSFANCNLTLLVFENCTFSGCTFTTCKLPGVDWTGIRESSLGSKLRFGGCNLDYGFFAGLQLPETTFDECSLREADFTGSNLERARIKSCNLERARFDRASLRDADMRGSRDYTIDVRTVDMRGAVVSLPECLDLFGAIGVKIGDLDPPDISNR